MQTCSRVPPARKDGPDEWLTGLSPAPPDKTAMKASRLERDGHSRQASSMPDGRAQAHQALLAALVDIAREPIARWRPHALFPCALVFLQQLETQRPVAVHERRTGHAHVAGQGADAPAIVDDPHRQRPEGVQRATADRPPEPIVS